MRSDDPQVPAYGSELFQSKVNLLEGVGGHQAGAQPALRRWHRGRSYWIGEYAGIEKTAPHEEGLFQWADQDRDDRCLRRPDVESKLPETILKAVGVGPQLVPPFRFLLQHLQRSQHTGGVGRWQRGGEDQRTAMVAEIMDDVFRRCHEATDRSQRLGESARDNVHFFGHAVMGRRAIAV